MSTTKTRTVSGRVVDRTGEPVPGATVAVVSSDEPHPDIAVLTTPEGAFRLSGLSGQVVLEARKSGVSGTAALDLGDDTVQVEIRLGGPDDLGTGVT